MRRPRGSTRTPSIVTLYEAGVTGLGRGRESVRHRREVDASDGTERLSGRAMPRTAVIEARRLWLNMRAVREISRGGPDTDPNRTCACIALKVQSANQNGETVVLRAVHPCRSTAPVWSAPSTSRSWVRKRRCEEVVDGAGSTQPPRPPLEPRGGTGALAARALLTPSPTLPSYSHG